MRHVSPAVMTPRHLPSKGVFLPWGSFISLYICITPCIVLHKANTTLLRGRPGPALSFFSVLARPPFRGIMFWDRRFSFSPSSSLLAPSRLIPQHGPWSFPTCQASSRLFSSLSHSISPNSGTPTGRSTASASPHPNVAMRGRRRKNFADEDEIRNLKQYSSPLSHHPHPGTSSSLNAGTSASPYKSTLSSFSTSSLFSFWRSFLFPTPSWISRLLIRSMWIPYIGVGVSKLCEWGAWPLYLSGKVVFYYRPSSSIEMVRCAAQDTPVSKGNSTSTASKSHHHHHHCNTQRLVFPESSTFPPILSCRSHVSRKMQTVEGMRSTAVLYVGRSAIHGRGIFAGVPLPRGTRLPLSGWWVHPPPFSSHERAEESHPSDPALLLPSSPVFFSSPRCFLPGPSYVLIFSDTYERLPDTLHYTHPTGKWLEVLLSQGETPNPLPPLSFTHARRSSCSTSAVDSATPSLQGRGSAPHFTSPASFLTTGRYNYPSFSHALLNHSCEANVCSGLSTVFWPAALAADYCWRKLALQHADSAMCPTTTPKAPLSWRTRVREFEGFHNPNAFFAARDIEADEELTIDYGCRVSPLYYTGGGGGGDSRGTTNRSSRHRPWKSWLFYGGSSSGRGSFSSLRTSTPSVLCRCGASSCRYRLYQPPSLLGKHFESQLLPFLSMLPENHPEFNYRTHPITNATVESNKSCLRSVCNDHLSLQKEGGKNNESEKWAVHEDFRVAVELFARGYDDEGTVLSSLPSASPLLQYISGEAIPTLQCSPLFPPTLPPPLETAKYSKSNFLLSYRHLFAGLNELTPQKKI